jgi:hypothetical protein
MIDKWQEIRNAAEKAQGEGKYGFAESLWYQALEEAHEFEKTDKRRATSLERLCECLWYQQKFSDAVPLAEELVDIYTQVFGATHIDTACMQANLGLLYVVQNRPVEADPILREALTSKLKALGVGHPDVVRLDATYKDVVAKLKSQGMSPSGVVTGKQWTKTGRFEALKVDTVEIQKPALPQAQSIPQKMANAINLEAAIKNWQPLFDEGRAAFNKGDWRQAESQLFKAAGFSNNFDEKDSRRGMTLELLADALSKQDKHQLAVPYLEQVHAAKTRQFGRLSVSVAESANNMARCHYYYGNYDAAEKNAIECTKIYEEMMGEDDLTVATCLGNMAMLYRLIKRPADAENAYKRCLTIRTKKQGGDHPETIKLLQNYAGLLRDMHREDEAEHLQACATGFVTGSWKTVEINEEAQLTMSKPDIGLVDPDSCTFCGTALGGAFKCGTCGTEVQVTA